MIKCGRSGATLLYGTKCVGCDCHLARFHDGGFVRDDPGTVRVMGFDLASKPDQTVHIRVSDRYEFSVEDIERASASITRETEAHLRREAERRSRAMDAEILRTLHGQRWEPGMDARTRPSHAWGAPPRSHAVEIITDPADRRGLDAKPIGDARS